MTIIISRDFGLDQLIFADIVIIFSLFPALTAIFRVCHFGAVQRFAVEANPCVALVPEASAATPFRLHAVH